MYFLVPSYTFEEDNNRLDEVEAESREAFTFITRHKYNRPDRTCVRRRIRGGGGVTKRARLWVQDMD